MKTISLILIAIIIPLTSFPALIKAKGGGGGFPGSSIGAGRGFFGGAPTTPGTGFMQGGAEKPGSPGYMQGSPEKPGSPGYMQGGPAPVVKPGGGGDTGPAIVVIPKKKPIGELPKPCKEEYRECLETHINGDPPTEPPFQGSCCNKLKRAKPCVCTFITSTDPKVKNGADGFLRGCHYRKPICIPMPMPPACRPEVRNCINHHMYGSSGMPIFHGACCTKFKTSKSCVTKFLTSPDPKLSEAARGVMRGCHFKG